MVKTDDSAVFLFTNVLTAMVFTVTVYLSSGNKGGNSEEPLLLP
jgi:hypothetical protein